MPDFDPEAYAKQAAAVDAKVAAGQDPGPRTGVPVAAKNLFDIEGITTLAGALLPAHWLQQAQRVRAAYRARALSVFDEVDVLIAPATPFVAPKIGQEMSEVKGAMIPVRPNLGVYTQPISCIGLPVIAASWGKAKLFRVAAALEKLGICASPAVRA